ncbi:MAG: hypothetical protein CXT67_00055 [Methanobacteriota archaeon]|nr:MAG: hypothetical protein CXT67_00055 [Euryarchaeota archaeon]
MRVKRVSDEHKRILRDIKTSLTKLIDKPDLELKVECGMIGDERYRVYVGEQMTLRAYTTEDGVQSFPVIIVTISKHKLKEIVEWEAKEGDIYSWLFPRAIYNDSIKNKLG